MSYVDSEEAAVTFHGDFARFATVEFGHALDLGKSDKVAILEAMSSFIQRRYQALLILHRLD